MFFLLFLYIPKQLLIKSTLYIEWKINRNLSVLKN
jgi:hypothetical protein